MADSFEGIGDNEIFIIDRTWNVTPTMKQDIQVTVAEYPGTIHGLTFDRFPVKTLSFEVEGERDEFIALLVFFADCLGRLKKFWMPDLFSLFVPTEIIIDDEIRLRVEKIDGLTLHGKELLYFELLDGSKITKSFSSYSHGEDYTEFILDSIFEEGFEVSNIAFFSLCYLGRFDQDALDIEYISDLLASTKIQFVELYEEY